MVYILHVSCECKCGHVAPTVLRCNTHASQHVHEPRRVPDVKVASRSNDMTYTSANVPLRQKSTVERAPVACKAISTQLAIPSKRGKGHTLGSVKYLQKPKEGDELYLYVSEVPADLPSASNLERTEKVVQVNDLRLSPTELNLQKNGVELHRIEVPTDIDWNDEKEVEQRYYPIIEETLIKVTGASRVHIFDHTLRKGHLKPNEGDEITPEARRQPVGLVHVDYTAQSGRDRLTALLPEEANSLQETPFAVIQVWKPLKGPVKSSPLGVIDASTVHKADLLSYKIVFPGRTGYNYGVAYNPEHRWYYASNMMTDEIYIFVCYDSRHGRARFTPHTGFRDHSVGPDADERESIELRSYCFWQNETPQAAAKEL